MQQSSGVPVQRTPSQQWAPSSPTPRRKSSVCGQYTPSKFRPDVCTECFHKRLAHAQSILQDELLSKEDPYEVFELLSKIGNGTFGSVFLAKERQTQKNVAIKFLRLNQDKKTIEGLVNEINILKESIECPYVVEYYGCYMKENYIMIVMEYCWCSVNDLLELCPEYPFNETQISAMCACIVKGLAYIHAEGIGHRDIKPGNLLLTEDGQLKLADFGISVKMRHSRDKMMDLAGSPYWCAPEIIDGESSYDKSVDIWSLGIVAIELAEGKPPLHDLSPLKVLKEIPKRPPPRLKEPHKWSNDFVNFVELCLQKNPKERTAAKSLLKHPFVLRGSNAQILQSMVKHFLPIIEVKKPKRGMKPHPVSEYSIQFEETDNTVVVVSSKTNQFETEKIFDEYGNEIGADSNPPSLNTSTDDLLNNNNNNDDTGTFQGPDSAPSSPSQETRQPHSAEHSPPTTQTPQTAPLSPMANIVLIDHYMSPRGSAERDEPPAKKTNAPVEQAKLSPPTLPKVPNSPKHDSTRGIVLPFKGPHYTKIKKEQPKRNSRKVQKLFAVPLENTYNPRKNDHMIDQIIHHIKKKGLDIDGIFRLKGKHAKMVELKVLFENRAMVDLNSYHIFEVINVYELFFFYLPESPFTQAAYSKFLESSEIMDPSARAAAIKTTLDSLPTVNKVFLKRVFSLFSDVCAHSEKNGMTPARLAKYVTTMFVSKDDIVHTNKDPLQKLIISCVDHYTTIFGGS